MGTDPNLQDRENPSNHASSPIAASSRSNTIGVIPAAAAPPPPTPPLLTPVSIPGSDANPCPTTFIQADTSSFKQVVQMLTGSAETAAKHVATASASASAPSPTPSKSPFPPAARATGPKKPAFKLYERRGSLKHINMISPLNHGSPAAFPPRMQPEVLSPSMLDLPSLVLSPVTPLIPDPFGRFSSRPNSAASWEEERAIAEKGFYLHPSPRTTPRDADPPRLLPLFPVTSPKLSSAAAAAAASSPP